VAGELAEYTGQSNLDCGGVLPRAWLIKFGLTVGIGGGVSPKVRLGDEVVSTPVGQFPGVVQWDFGKAKEGSSFERTGSLNKPTSGFNRVRPALLSSLGFF
jgi:hypothetical protein